LKGLVSALEEYFASMEDCLWICKVFVIDGKTSTGLGKIFSGFGRIPFGFAKIILG
jgi:hypothetical protein